MAEKKKICQANNHTGQNNRTGKTFFQNLINVHTEIRAYRREKVLKKNKHTGSFIQESRVPMYMARVRYMDSRVLVFFKYQDGHSRVD